jgi:two-component system phosphate regulon sensor histidine kinase PhoR
VRLELDEQTRGRTADLFEIMGRNLQRIDDLIRHVLETKGQSAIPGGVFRPERRSFELWPLVQRLIVDLRSVSSKHDIKVVNEIPRALTVYADAGLISQVFQNLLGNAFKYAARGQVVVSAMADGGTVTCVVKDNGSGIPLEMLAKVFKKHASDPEQASTGLGLTIVKQIVEAHGGSVTAESTHGAGATLTFTLPSPAET